MAMDLGKIQEIIDSRWPSSKTKMGTVLFNHSLRGRDIGCLFIRPRPDSDIAGVGVGAGTGLAGLSLTNNLPYLYPGYGFPDLFIARPGPLVQGIPGIEATGFFGQDWRVETGDIAWNPEQPR